MITTKMIQIAKPMIGIEEEKAVLEVLRSGTLAQGKKVEQFEKAFAEYCNVDYAIAVNSGTAALQVTLMAMGIGKGDEVITTPFSFVATANAILSCGATPVFADINERTFNITPGAILDKITDKTKAILPVHLFGQACNMDDIMLLAIDNNLKVIEDACQAHGATYKETKVGGIGDAGTFSFYPTKNMTTSEGGMITTNDPEIDSKARILRNHGQIERKSTYLSYNYRMTDIAAAIGIEQLKKLDTFNMQRYQNADCLSRMIHNPDIEVPYTIKDADPVYNQYTIKVDNRDELIKKLTEKGVGSAIYYPTPINEQPLYKSLGYKADTPFASKVAKQVMSLPVHPSLDRQDMDNIAMALW